MKKSMIAALLLLALAGVACTDSNKATRVLSDQGYTNIQITGYAFLGCSEDDTFSTGFTATSPAGKQVSGVVCSSWFTKGATIRFN